MKQGKQLQAATCAWFYKTSLKVVITQTGVSKRRLKNALKKFSELHKIAKETGARKPRLIAVSPTFSVPYGK
jgi:hypothetical protein